MPIAVQLPGYNHAAPAAALADVINAGSQVYSRYKQNQAQDIANQQSKQQADAQAAYQQANTDPNSQLSESKRQTTALALGEAANNASDPNTKAGLAQLHALVTSGSNDYRPDINPGQGPTAPTKLSGLDVDQLSNSPGLSQLLKQQSEQTSLQKVIEAGSLRNEGVRYKTDNQLNKANQITNKDWQKLSDAIDPNKARGGNLAKSQSVINASDRVEAMFQQFPDGNIPKAQSTELATAVAALISGGSPQSQHQIDSIVPSSAAGRAEDIVAWFTNDPKGRQQQAFMNILKETSTRERAVALSQVREAQGARLPQFDYLYNDNPNKYRNILNGYGFKPEEIDSNGLFMRPTAQAPIGKGVMGFDQWKANRNGK